MTDDARPPMGRLDASWRGDYITKATAASVSGVDEGCVFCALIASGRPDAETYIVHQGTHAITILNAYPYTSGHVMVMPRRHVPDLQSLDADEHTELWNLVTHADGAVRRAYAPEGLNIGANVGRAAGAGIPGHLHIHLVPRWNGDTNFMTSIAEARVVPESLDVTWKRLTAAW
jgi:diadenosine tetraphosphate (Ap4A) HIT family hydrolase